MIIAYKLHRLTIDNLYKYIDKEVRHFKGKSYMVKSISRDADTNEILVTYLALYGDGILWTRKLYDFLSKVPEGRETDQEYRFMGVEYV